MIFQNVNDVVRWRLCVGCGACTFICEAKNIALEDVPDQGIRPTVRGKMCGECRKCIEICPGLMVIHDSRLSNGSPLLELQNDWGPILEMWEGHATDPEIRYLGSSGGVATAIALYCLETGIAGNVLHVGKDGGKPWLNRTVISRTHQDLLTRTGSRYSPASACDGLGEIELASSPSVLIGKSCEIQGLRRAEVLWPRLGEKVSVTVGIFCAGTPASAGVLGLLKRLDIAAEDVEDIRFRGSGWPGSFAVRAKRECDFSRKISYQDSWSFLQAYRPFRCYLCPDGTSEFADISCGDPWYREPEKDAQGCSLVLVRTEKGRKILEGATKAGYLCLEQAEPWVLEASQSNLLTKRRAIWGRILAMKAFGIPTPRYKGFPLFRNWRDLPMGGKARSILGTVRRIIQRGYYRPVRGGYLEA